MKNSFENGRQSASFHLFSVEKFSLEEDVIIVYRKTNTNIQEEKDHNVLN